jgi:hypothetical protein
MEAQKMTTQTEILIDRFFLVYRNQGPQRCVWIPSVPADSLVSPEPDLAGYVEWKLIPQPKPFGDESLLDAGPLCFDTRHPARNGDWPIVYWDHEFDKTPGEIGQCCTSYLESNEKPYKKTPGVLCHRP